MKLTATVVRTLALPPGKRDHVEWDDDIPCFGVRLREGGSKVFVFQYKAAGRSRKMTLGAVSAVDVGKARVTAKDLYARKTLGQDPAGEKAAAKVKSGETFEACLKLYLERRRHDVRLRASSYREIERHLLRNLKALHPLSIDKVDRRAIALELGRLTERGPVQANRARASLVKFLNWCAGEGLIDSNPAQFTNKNPETSRDRVLLTAELVQLWRALPDGDFGDVIKLLMLTGQREREIGDLRWSEIDFDRGIITLPPARTKNRRWHTVPLSAPAAAILSARLRHADRDLVFGRGQGGFSGWGYSKLRLDERLKISPWVIHDLRRSAVTGMGELGVLPHVIEAIVNHASGSKSGVAGVYNKSTYEGEKATALTRWAAHLMAAIEGRATNITPFKRA